MFARSGQGRSLSLASFDEKAVDRVVFEFCERLVWSGLVSTSSRCLFPPTVAL